MFKLLEKESKFDFDETCLIAFEEIKKNLVSTPIIITLDWGEPFEVMCNARGAVLGVVLGKRREKILSQLLYKKSLNASKNNYTYMEQHLLAVVFAFEKFHFYLFGIVMIVHMDHSTLRYLMVKKDAKPRLIRCVLFLQEFDFVEKDRKGGR